MTTDPSSIGKRAASSIEAALRKLELYFRQSPPRRHATIGTLQEVRETLSQALELIMSIKEPLEKSKIHVEVVDNLNKIEGYVIPAYGKIKRAHTALHKTWYMELYKGILSVSETIKDEFIIPEKRKTFEPDLLVEGKRHRRAATSTGHSAPTNWVSWKPKKSGLDPRRGR